MNRLLISNSTKYRLLRTVIQGVVGVIISNLDVIITHVPVLPMWSRPIVAALVMAVLSPIMASMGTYDLDKPELERDHWEDENSK